MSEKLEELRSLPDEDLVARHDALASHASIGLNYYLRELARRDQERQTDAMLRYTRYMTAMTVVILLLTVVNVVVVVASLCR